VRITSERYGLDRDGRWVLLDSTTRDATPQEISDDTRHREFSVVKRRLQAGQKIIDVSQVTSLAEARVALDRLQDFMILLARQLVSEKD
jgi:hypothetical protein